jgi:hypothetical protein
MPINNDEPLLNISEKSRKSLCLSATDLFYIIEMEPYAVYLVALAFLSIALAYHRYNTQKQEVSEESLALPNDGNESAATKFKWEYFSLYGLVMAADWLQVSQRLICWIEISSELTVSPFLGTIYVYSI